MAQKAQQAAPDGHSLDPINGTIKKLRPLPDDPNAGRPVQGHKVLVLTCYGVAAKVECQSDNRCGTTLA